MRYEGEVRWRFKGDPGLCSRYIPQARTFCAFTMSLQGDGVETYQRRQELPDGVRFKVMKFPAMVPIIEIDVSNVTADESPKLRGFIIRPWEDGEVDAIDGADKELVLSYRTSKLGNYYTFWPSKTTPQYGQARENYAYLPNFPSGFSKFGNILWTNGELSCSIHGPARRYWGTNGSFYQVFDYFGDSVFLLKHYRSSVYSCGRQIYNQASENALHDPYRGLDITGAAIKKTENGFRLYVARGIDANSVIVSYPIVDSTELNDTHMVDCRAFFVHWQGSVSYKITGWFFNSSCSAAACVSSESPLFNNSEIVDCASILHVVAGGDGSWSHSSEQFQAQKTVRNGVIPVVDLIEFDEGAFSQDQLTTDYDVTILVGVDYVGDELTPIYIDASYYTRYDIKQIRRVVVNQGTGRPNIGPYDAAVAYAQSLNASDFVQNIHCGGECGPCDTEAIDALTDHYNGVISSAIAGAQFIRSQVQSAINNYDSAVDNTPLDKYTAYPAEIKEHVTLRFADQRIVVKDYEFTQNVNFEVRNLYHNLSTYVAPIVCIPEPVSPCGCGSGSNRHFGGTPDGDYVIHGSNSVPDGTVPPPGYQRTEILRVSSSTICSESNGCQYGCVTTNGWAYVSVLMDEDIRFSGAGTSSVRSVIQPPIELNVRLGAHAFLEYEVVYTTPHVGGWETQEQFAHYAELYPVSNINYQEVRIRSKIISGANTRVVGEWFHYNNNDDIDETDVLRRRIDRMFVIPLLTTKYITVMPDAAAWASDKYLRPDVFYQDSSQPQHRMYLRVHSEFGLSSVCGHGGKKLVAATSFGDDVAVAWISDSDAHDQTGFQQATRMYPASFFPKYIIEGER